MVIALVLLATLAIGFGGYVTLAVLAWRADVLSAPMLLAGAPLLYAAVIAALTASWFLATWVARTPRPAGKGLGFAATVRLVVLEWLTLMGSPFRMGVGWWFMHEPAPTVAARPVLLLHGVLCNAGVWLGMRRRLCARGAGPIYTLSYGPPLASIEDFADELATRIEEILRDTGASSVLVVGHSMGGLVARAYLRRCGGGRVAQLVTIGTPHHGSVLAGRFPGRCLAEMRPGSAWLRALNASPLPRDVPIVSIWSRHDSMVAPQASSELPGARNIALEGIGHNALLRDAGVTRLVAELLKRNDPCAGERALQRQPDDAEAS